MSARERGLVGAHLRAFVADASLVACAARRRGAKRPWLAAAADTSTWALALLRGGAALRAATGSTLGAHVVLRTVFHIDVWTDAVGPGLRLPHPFGIVIGEGAHIGANCTIMHHVTVQRGEGTTVGDGAVLGTGAVVLAGARVGDGAIVGAVSVVRGAVPDRTVAVGAPARVVRDVRPGETR